ncbi:hypothetical protein ACLK1Y_16300 [Escherichia coli]
MVITESGRAVTARTTRRWYVIGVERSEQTQATPPATMCDARCKACGKPGRRCTSREPPACGRRAARQPDGPGLDIHVGYSSGSFSLHECAWAEQLTWNMRHE